MTAKEYLKQIRQLDIRINQKLSELDDLRERATAIGSFDYSKDRVQTSPKPDASYVEIVEKMAKLGAEINRDIDTFTDKRHAIIAEIHGLDDRRFVEILYKRYMEYKSLGTIAKEMSYEYITVRKLHIRALEEFESVYTNIRSLVL